MEYCEFALEVLALDGTTGDTLAVAISMKIINNITHYLRCGLRGASG
jgi:hypothetical protein